MDQNLTQPSPYKDEIDLIELFKKLFYSLTSKPDFKSSSIFEIGYYEMSDGTLKLIEEPSDTISNIKTNLIYKKRDIFLLENLIIKSPENKLIELQITSKSSKKNVDLLSKVNKFIDERHSKLALSINKQKKAEISQQINLIESALSSHKERILISKESTKLELEAKISKLQSNLPIVNEQINQLKQIIIVEKNNLDILKGSTLSQERMAISPSLEQVIFNYESRERINLEQLIFNYESNLNELRKERNNTNADINFLYQKLDILNKIDWLETDDLEIASKLEKENKFIASEAFLSQVDVLFGSQVDVFFSLIEEQKVLEKQLEMLSAKSIVKTRPVGDIQTDTIKPKIALTILLGLVIGFITSIFLVLISNFVKSYKESQA